MGKVTTPVSRTVSANGIRLHYLDWGGDGQPVILIHATGLVGAVWQPLAEALRQAGYRPIAYDQRGHGDSTKPPSGYGFATGAADLRAFRSALGLPTAVGIGLSGGATAIALAAAAEPAAFDRAVLIEPIVFPNHDIADVWEGHTRSMVNRTIKRRTVWASRDEIDASYRSRPPFSAWRDDMLRAYLEWGTAEREDGQIELKCPPAIEAQYYQAAPEIDPWPALRSLTLPVLIIRGEHSEPVGPNQGAAIRDAIPGAELLDVAGVGHFVPMEAPEIVERAVLDFLARTRRDG